MSSSIRLTSSGAPDTPPLGYARIFVEEYNGKLQLKMIRPDGSIEIFGTIGTPLEIEYGGTGISDIPEIGEFLIGTGTGYRLGQIVAGSGVNITKTATNFEISTDISNIELQMPPEFNVIEQSASGQNVFVVGKTEQVKNSVYIAPLNADGVPTFRFLQVEDLPDLPISKIINLVETIRAESLLIPVDSTDIDHTYDTTAKTLSSTIKPTTVTSGSYGSATQVPTFNVRTDGRLDAATGVTIAIPHTQITDFKEAAEDVVGELVENSTSINVEYDDYNNYLKFHVNEEYLITTNISDTENQRAPTSQAIKQYVDDLTVAERTARIFEDNAINQRLNNFFQNAPTALDSIVEISQRFEAIQDTIRDGLVVSTQQLTEQLTGVNSEIDILQSNIEAEITARIEEIANLHQKIDRGLIIPDYEIITIAQTDVENNYILIGCDTIIPKSVTVSLDRVMLFEEIDFAIESLTDGTSKISFTSNVSIESGEVLKVNYLYSESLNCNISANYENFVITPQDIENGYLYLTNSKLLPESITAFVDRIPLLQGIDFLVTRLVNNIYKLTFIGDLLPQQTLALEPGENIRVNYLCRT